MELSEDLGREALQPLLGSRALRTYPAMLSTETEAMAWARTGAPDGAVVTAGYVAAPRGRSGLDWDGRAHPDGALACSVVLRPGWTEQREGWCYLPALLGVRDALAQAAGGVPAPPQLVWPDHLVDEHGDVVAAVGGQAEPAGGRLRWVVVTVLVFHAPPPRAPLLAAVVDALERWVRADADEVVAAATGACATIGRRVTAALLPMGPASPSVTGEAVGLADDGGLVVIDDQGRRVVVLPQALGLLEDPDAGAMGPTGIG